MFLFRLLNFLAGYLKVICPAAFSREVVNRLARQEIDYWELKRGAEGELSFYILEKEFRRLQKSEGEPIAYHVSRRYGLPQWLARYHRRFGIPIGMILLLVLTKLSTQFVWEVTVSGNETLSDAAIIDSLEELGCAVGSYIPDVDFYRICHAFILENEEVSWISVNMIGTTARVEVIETDVKGNLEEEGNGTPSNLVARFDGEIVRTETASGKVTVMAGQTVTAGQLLVSGVVDIGREEEGRFHLVRARGKVYAQTTRRISVEVPLNREKITVLGEEVVEKTIKFFGKNIKLKENSSILPEGCDIIEKSRRLVLWEQLAGGIPLPIYLTTSTYELRETTTVLLTRDEALAVARQEMAELFQHEFAEADILSRAESIEESEDRVVLHWDIVSVENIAHEVPIGVS